MNRSCQLDYIRMLVHQIQDYHCMCELKPELVNLYSERLTEYKKALRDFIKYWIYN